jgi:hypothetical protein
MRKPPTGEPYAGKPPVRFGGRGGPKPFPTPIVFLVTAQAVDGRDIRAFTPVCDGLCAAMTAE